MDSYQALAPYYDRFTDDVPYDQWADFVETLFTMDGQKPEIVLDLACGTGAMTCRLARRGYDLIGVDGAEEMLMQARENAAGLNPPPLFLQQDMTRLDLYGTVGACVCCLDSINYLTEEEQLQRVFDRVALFLEPGGRFVFDVNTAEKWRRLDGESYVRQDEEAYCVYQLGFEEESGRCFYQLDLFLRQPDGDWRRLSEEHEQRVYPRQQLVDGLHRAGLEDIRIFPELSLTPAAGGEGRLFFSARKPGGEKKGEQL